MSDEKKTTVDQGATQMAGTDKTVVDAQGAAGKAAASKAKKKVTQIGDYKLIRKLGEGGMGEVFLAKQVSLDRNVAIKTLAKHLAKKEDFVKRFHREARAMAKMDHPNAVKVYAVEQVGGINFAAIEFIDGQSMQDWMDDLKTLPVGDAVHITLLCAEALAAAHQLTLIHRDIKPDNILVTKTGVVKVADFGLAKSSDDDMSMTQSGTGLGTPLYMAPEQARNAKYVDHRSDIYALGTTLYYFVTGKLPYMGESALELIKAKEEGRFTPAKSVNPQVPEKLDLMIEKMIQKKPEHRYQSCEEVIRDLTSLNLASEQLSFIDSPQRSTLRTSNVGKPTSGVTRPTSAVPPPPMSSAEDAERKQAPKAEKDWFVKFKNLAGKITISKMTSSQIERGLKAGTLDMHTQLRVSANDAYQPIARFPEFADAVEKRAVRERAEKRGRDMKDTYAKLDKQHSRRGIRRFFRNLKSGALGWVGLAIWLAFIAAVLFGIYIALRRWAPGVLESIGLK